MKWIAVLTCLLNFFLSANLQLRQLAKSVVNRQVLIMFYGRQIYDLFPICIILFRVAGARGKAVS